MATRRALMAAGAELFAARGFGGTPVDLIARRARVNKAMISYHFGGKQGLYEAILADTFAHVSERLLDLRQSLLSADDRLKRFIDIFGELQARSPTLSAMILLEMISGGKHIRDRVLPYFQTIFSILREIIEDGVREGSFRAVDPFLTHLSLVGSLVFFFATKPARDRMILERRLPLSIPGSQDFVRHVKDLMARGMTAEARDREPNRS